LAWFHSANIAMTTRHRSTTPPEKTVALATPPQQDEPSTKYTDGESDEFEFGGSFGAASLMIGFPLLMWYMWIGATYYDGQFPLPEAHQTWGDFTYHLFNLVYDGAYPTAKAWAVYWTFFICEALMSVALFSLQYCYAG
jgi:delta24(24(1))-sterol reductase